MEGRGGHRTYLYTQVPRGWAQPVPLCNPDGGLSAPARGGNRGHVSLSLPSSCHPPGHRQRAPGRRSPPGRPRCAARRGAERGSAAGARTAFPPGGVWPIKPFAAKYRR